GLFIHPVIGPKKEGDYTAEIILNTYELIIDKYYPKDKVFLAAFQNYSRYCGPREAVFTALCRKNFGCSHFIVGRDHTGVGNHYKLDDAHKLFERLGDIGIVPIFFNEMHYCRKCGKYIEKCEHDRSDILSVSGTEGRNMLKLKKTPPDWFMRREISDFILSEIEENKEVFVK
ncbi:MAG: sulfate adenylyltransferase, partial [Candidatus Omnitrophica bacterium]|nr:sulfate adenylyltransferase [Candidatus Omnitrophota bacterium]